MDDVVIKVEHLSKQYRLGVIGHGTLSQDLQSWWARFRGKEDPNAKIDLLSSHRTQLSDERFWALKDVSFEVRKGEILGIIGRNGAGKSTLLKILSRVTAPTSGSVKIKGRVASLLEVGTGFHPELTGRENVFLNGAILGMTKREIESKFDEIVRFAEIEQFIDTPVKRYSSGMYVRLAFAVAAHLEPEILIIDEVLAVGDASFQKKCLGKMGEVAGEGRTVLFVSHNMSFISSLCDNGILLNRGKIEKKGPILEVTRAYLNFGCKKEGEIIFSEPYPGDNKVQLLCVSILNKDKKPIKDIRIDEDIFVQMEYKVLEDGLFLYASIFLRDQFGNTILHSIDSSIDPNSELKLRKGVYYCKCCIPGNFLNSIAYYISVSVCTVDPLIVHFSERDILFFNVIDPISDVPTRPNKYLGSLSGSLVRPLLQWELMGPFHD